jgi:3-hydroxyisobutyrate dehydrogenase-like beta-hydroxyacid dehydrogenase
MSVETVAIFGPGDMGSNVGRALRAHGLRVVTCLAGRSQRSRGLAAGAGFEDLPSLEAVMAEADLVLSIMPPANAVTAAHEIAAAMRRAGTTPPYADCNAISPDTTRRVGAAIATTGAPFIDAGIVGPAPGRGQPPRFYVSGPEATVMDALDGKDIDVRQLGPEIGRASAMKMCYASLTKGAWTLYAATLTVAARSGLAAELIAELDSSRPTVLAEMRRMVPRLPADSGRWIGEMEEIAATFAGAGVTSYFHQGAADTFRLLASTPLAEETRETLDTSRTLEQTVAIFAAAVDSAAGGD